MASVVSNLERVWHIHIVLTMTAEDYLAQMGHMFIYTYNPGDYPQRWGITKKKRS